jgi:hypothetical protein
MEVAGLCIALLPSPHVIDDCMYIRTSSRQADDELLPQQTHQTAFCSRDQDILLRSGFHNLFRKRYAWPIGRDSRAFACATTGSTMATAGETVKKTINIGEKQVDMPALD